jgi:hypothetical protein
MDVWMPIGDKDIGRLLPIHSCILVLSLNRQRLRQEEGPVGLAHRGAIRSIYGEGSTWCTQVQSLRVRGLRASFRTHWVEQV